MAKKKFAFLDEKKNGLSDWATYVKHRHEPFTLKDVEKFEKESDEEKKKVIKVAYWKMEKGTFVKVSFKIDGVIGIISLGQHFPGNIYSKLSW